MSDRPSRCLVWGTRGHNLFMGGMAVYRDWPRFWRQYRPCISCGAKVSSREPLPAPWRG